MRKIDVKTAFIQTGKSTRDVYIISPMECNDSGKVLWLLLAADYGLKKTSAKWQVMSDSLLISIGFTHVAQIPQLFYIKSKGLLVFIIARIEDDILITGIESTVKEIINKIKDKLKFGTISHAPGNLLFFGITFIQEEEFSIQTMGDENITSLEPYHLFLHRCQQIYGKINSTEKNSFALLSSSVSWHTTSTFCSEFLSRMKQIAPSETVKTLVKIKWPAETQEERQNCIMQSTKS